MSTPPWGQEPEGRPGPPPPPSPQPGAYLPYGQQPPSPYGSFEPSPQTNPLAVGSLIVSIVSVLFCCGLPGIAGALMGHAARRQIRQQPDQTGDGLAVGGIIVGWIGFALALLVVILYVVLIVIFGVWAVSLDDMFDDCHYDDNGSYVCD